MSRSELNLPIRTAWAPAAAHSARQSAAAMHRRLAIMLPVPVVCVAGWVRGRTGDQAPSSSSTVVVVGSCRPATGTVGGGLWGCGRRVRAGTLLAPCDHTCRRLHGLRSARLRSCDPQLTAAA